MKTKQSRNETLAARAETSIRAVVDCPRGGRIVTMGFPGLAVDFDGTSYMDPHALAATLDSPALLGSAVLIALAETHELPDDHWRHLQDALDQRHRRLEQLPIEDFSVPDAAFLKEWQIRSPQYHDILDQGGTIGVTCHYGAGRSGTIAAYLMIERGARPDEAIACVRQVFPESIESSRQFDWLQEFG